jgi:proline iminopeptidase
MRVQFLLVILLLPALCIGQGQKIRINGTDLYVSARGKGEELIVLHGGPGLNHHYFLPHLEDLEKKFRVIYYDQRASGQSAIPAADSISLRFFIEDLEKLREHFGIRKLNILAHSWSAVLAFQYALAYPRKVNKIIVTSPAMLSREFDQQAAKLAKERTTKEDSLRRAELMRSGPMDKKMYEDFFLLSFKSSAYDPENLRRLQLNLPDNFQEASKALFTGFMKDPDQQKNLYGSLKELDFPVLIIQGKSDIIPEESIRKLRESLPHATISVFEKSGHFPFIEEKEKFIDVVSDFLKQNKR